MLKGRRYSIGYRTLKTALAAAVAIAIAQWLQLDHFTSAGILAILNIQVTQKKSFVASGVRFVACLLGLVVSFFFFELFGYHPLTISVLLVLFIPLLVMLGLQQGVVTSAVIMFHIYTFGEMTMAIFLNEVALICIGIGTALLANLYMPNMEQELVRYQRQIEHNFSRIFQELSLYLREGDHKWDGKEITETDQLLQEAKSLAYRDVENHFLRHENEFYHYFKMREKQFDILERIIPIISSLSYTVVQGKKIAQFLDEVSVAVHAGNTAKIFQARLEELREEIKEMPLPREREEFQVRASLFHFLNEMERYLEIKRQFKPSDV